MDTFDSNGIPPKIDHRNIQKFMCSEIRKIHLPNYQGYYENDDNGVDMRYIFDIKCDELWRDVIDKITG